MKWSMGGSRFIALLPYCQRRVGARAARCSTMLATSEESQVLKLGQAWKRAYHDHHQAPPVSTVGVRDGDAPSISIGHQVRSSSMEAAAVLELSDPATPTLATLRSQSLSSTEAAATELSAPATPTLAALRSRLSSGGPSLMDFITSSSSSPEGYSVEVGTKKAPKPKPEWMKMVIPGGDKYAAIKSKLRELKLNTVCEEAKCPNIGECWMGGETGTATATIMILGDTCTRGCRFCAVKTSRAPPPPDPEEPKKVAEAIVAWGLDYVVLTSVDRDDMSDQGSNHFAETVRQLKSRKPSMLVEALVPDFQGDSKCVERVATSGLDVFAHNIETVEELQASVRDRRANFTQSIHVLQMAKEMAPPGTLTKTSIMLGCGETPVQVVETMRKVREAGVDVMTLGQYMRPTKRHMPVSEYITPEAFEEYRKIGLEMGFRYVASGPMVRSSYKAGEFFIKSMIEADREKDKLTSAASL